MPKVVVDHLRQVKAQNPFTDRIMSTWCTVSMYRFEFNDLFAKLSFTKLQNGLTLRPHDLRHQYGQSLLDAGLELEDIQKLLGHSSLRVTQERYVHYNNRDMTEKVDRLSKILHIG